MKQIIENLQFNFTNDEISTTVIVVVLLMVGMLALYEFLIYKFVSHRSFYNKQFNILVGIIPFFIAPIILCLQSNLVITLGTIGALAIIRFRTTVKDPTDMMYLLWSVFIGIMCGCQLYEVAVITSIVVTGCLILAEEVGFSKLPTIIIIHTKKLEEEEIKKLLSKYSKNYRVKSRNVTSKGMDYAIEIKVKNPNLLAEDLNKNKKIDKFSIIEYDADDIV